MGKSSSSTKRKRSKHSPQVRSKKRSKIKRSRSKKVRRRYDSVTYSSDASRSSVSVSSSSEDSYRHRRLISRSRKDVKVSRRRDSSYSSSSEESYRGRNRKRSRKNDDKSRKRNDRNKKKKVTKEASFSSRSCSRSGSDEGDNESRRSRPKRREKNSRKLKNVKSEPTRRRYRSRSCSSFSGHDGSTDQWSNEKVIDGNISKRLKSVITVTKDDARELDWDDYKEERIARESDWDEYKEEMVCNHDDYPSSRSNDSNDGGSKRLSDYQQCVESEKKFPIETEKKEDAYAFNVKTTKLPNSSKDGDKLSDGVGTTDPIKEKNHELLESSGNVNANDLESILRQKALENLRRFRGGIQKNVASAVNLKDDDDAIPKSLSATKAGDEGIQGVNSACSMQKEENILERQDGGNNLASAKSNANIPKQMAATVIYKPRLVTSALKQAYCTSMTREAPTSQDSKEVKLMIGSSVVKHNSTPLKGDGNSEKVNDESGLTCAESSSCLASSRVDAGLSGLQDERQGGSQLEQKTLSSVPLLSGTGNNTRVGNTSGSTSGEPPSHITSGAADVSSSKVQDDEREGSQLEEKTMSVMRGGEMVQVSYKVYIPKKAPALARRKLKR